MDAQPPPPGVSPKSTPRVNLPPPPPLPPTNYPAAHQEQPPLPPGPPPPLIPQTFQFGSRQEDSQKSEFTFRHDRGYQRHPQDFRAVDTRGGPHRYGGSRESDRYRPNASDADRRRQGSGNHSNQNQRHGNYSKRPPLRPLFHGTRQTTPEQFAGMALPENQTRKFLSVEDISDSDEREIEESQSDGSDSSHDERSSRPTDNNQTETQEPPRKRLAVADSASEKPKWSNPDHAAIVATEEASKKRRDVVKLIRKARITTDIEPRAAAPANDDFISLSLDGDLAGDDHRDSEQDGAEFADQHRSTNGDENLGNRKRTHDDVIRSHGPPLRGRNGAMINGNVLQQWLKPEPGCTPTPWIDRDHHRTESLGFWLHKEICDFYAYVKPRIFEDRVREDLLNRLRNAIVADFPNCDVRCFGSFAAGLYLPTADMDLVMLSNGFVQSGVSNLKLKYGWYSKLVYRLSHKGLVQAGSDQIIAKAKVPLVKFKDRLTGLQVDLSFENTSGLPVVETYHRWITRYPMMPRLVAIIKQYLLMRGLNEPASGGIGGYTVACLVISQLQMNPRVQSGVLGSSLGELLMDFFDFYGNEFDYQRLAISIDPPGYVDKAIPQNMPYKLKNHDRLSIIDPNKPENDISGGSSNVRTVLRSFSHAYDQLRDNMARISRLDIPDRQNESILGVILAGDYSSFDLQRSHLRREYESRQQRR
ncbi:MAG: hypothetical protein M1825_002062 [Sarcosagium campestre]|nr:MAG: hypothetical protein M1825_002062 [Sarcosagium campestre]